MDSCNAYFEDVKASAGIEMQLQCRWRKEAQGILPPSGPCVTPPKPARPISAVPRSTTTTRDFQSKHFPTLSNDFTTLNNSERTDSKMADDKAKVKLRQLDQAQNCG